MRKRNIPIHSKSCESNGGRRSPLVVIFWSQQNFCYQNQSPTSSLEQLSTMNNNPIAFSATNTTLLNIFHHVSNKEAICIQEVLQQYPWSSMDLILWSKQNTKTSYNTISYELPPPLVSLSLKNSLPPLNLRTPFQLHQYCHIPTQSPPFVCTREVAGTEWTNVPRC